MQYDLSTKDDFCFSANFISQGVLFLFFNICDLFVSFGSFYYYFSFD